MVIECYMIKNGMVVSVYCTDFIGSKNKHS
jgi:hypothetical protein